LGCSLALRVNAERRRATAAESAMQQEVDGVSSRQDESVDSGRTEVLKILRDAASGDLRVNDLLEIRMACGDTDVEVVAFIAAAAERNCHEWKFCRRTS
jgi:hypothetical protein